MRNHFPSLSALLGPSTSSHFDFPANPHTIHFPVNPPSLPPSQPVTIPPYKPLIHTTPSAQARLFDEVSYGDIPTYIGDETTRFALTNPNGVSRDGSYDYLSEHLLELLEIGVDVIHLPKSNGDWRSPREFKKCQLAVKTVFTHAKLITSSSTKRTSS
jgi:hypothetical protein